MNVQMPLLRAAMAGRLYNVHAKLTSNSGFDQTFMQCSWYFTVLRRRDTKESTCLLWDITTEKSGLCCYAVRITQNAYVKK